MKQLHHRLLSSVVKILPLSVVLSFPPWTLPLSFFSITPSNISRRWNAKFFKKQTLNGHFLSVEQSTLYSGGSLLLFTFPSFLLPQSKICLKKDSSQTHPWAVELQNHPHETFTLLHCKHSLSSFSLRKIIMQLLFDLSILAVSLRSKLECVTNEDFRGLVYLESTATVSCERDWKKECKAILHHNHCKGTALALVRLVLVLPTLLGSTFYGLEKIYRKFPPTSPEWYVPLPRYLLKPLYPTCPRLSTAPSLAGSRPLH